MPAEAGDSKQQVSKLNGCAFWCQRAQGIDRKPYAHSGFIESTAAVIAEKYVS